MIADPTRYMEYLQGYRLSVAEQRFEQDAKQILETFNRSQKKQRARGK